MAAMVSDIADPRPEPIAGPDGETAWLLRGPSVPVPDTDVWVAVARSLRGRSRAIRMRCGPCAMTGQEILAAVAALPLASGELIGVHLARAPALVLSVLATWRSGSVYVPLGIELPSRRLGAIIEALALRTILTEAPAGARPGDALSDAFDGYVVAALHVVAGCTIAVLSRRDASEEIRLEQVVCEIGRLTRSPCYVPHTSGTTGFPKAILVSHAALLNRLAALTQLVEPTSNDAVLFKTSSLFDVHVWELVFPLVSDAVLVIDRQARYVDPRSLARLVVDEGITVAGFVPALLRLLLDQPDFVGGNRLRVVFCGGEAWTPALARAFHRLLPGRVLRNSYGPAETTLAVANGLVLPGADVIELGAPLANTLFLVEAPEPSDGGINGLLAIGGVQVAEGYLPARDDDGFFRCQVEGVPISFYRTGDVVALDLATGALTYRGRRDHQIKLNGVRLELEEIEAAICSLDGIEASVVMLVAREERSFLLATYTVSSGADVSAADVRHRCAALLPPTHVPAMTRVIDRYPLTPSGKIDRARVFEAAGEAFLRDGAEGSPKSEGRGPVA